MRTIVQLAADQLAPALREALNGIYPNASWAPLNYDCEIDLEDGRLAHIEQILAAHGYSRWPGIREQDPLAEYYVNYMRQYDDSDWESADFLEIHPQAAVGRLGRSEDGRVSLPGLDLKPDQIAVASAFFDETILPERSKVKLEQQNLLGVEFVPTEICADKTRDPEVVFRMDEEDIPPYGGEPWWELRSRIELPPVSDTMTLVDHNERPLKRGSQRWMFRREQPYNHQELHYRRRDVQQFPDFDLARTWEEWAGCPALVASKRFYRACRELGLDMGWVPVRIDED